jgi:hypothetical protein
MNYTPVRVDKNTGNVWKWKRNEDGATISVPQTMWKSTSEWSESEVSSLFEGTVVAAAAPEPALEIISESEPVVEENVVEDFVEVDEPVAENEEEYSETEQDTPSTTSFI